MTRTKKALVIGASGQDGSFLCRSLLKKNYIVIGTTRNSCGTPKNHLTLGIEKDLRVNMGLEDEPCLKLLENVQYIENKLEVIPDEVWKFNNDLNEELFTLFFHVLIYV